MVLLLLLATIPAALVGALFESRIEKAFTSPLLASSMLLVTGTILFLVHWARETDADINWFRALMIGIAQAVAVIPGISRSGLTISTGLYLGVAPRKAADFSFLLSIPIILGAALVKLLAISGEITNAPVILAGAIAAALSGYLAIRLLLKIIRRRHFYLFAWYCWAIGIISLLILLCGD